MNPQPELLAKALDYADRGWQTALGWLVSPAAWSQFALLVVAWLLAVLLARRLAKVLTQVLTPASDADGILTQARILSLTLLPLLMPLLAYALTAAGEGLTRRCSGPVR